MTEHQGKIKAVVLHRAGKTATFTVDSDKDAVSFIAEMIVDGFRAAEGGGEVHMFAPAIASTEDWLSGPMSRRHGSKPATPAPNVVPIGTTPKKSGPKSVPKRLGPHLAGPDAIVIDLKARRPGGRGAA